MCVGQLPSGTLRLHGAVPGRPNRLVFAVSSSPPAAGSAAPGPAVALVQPCVETSLEMVSELPWPTTLPPGCVVNEVFASGWLYFDPDVYTVTIEPKEQFATLNLSQYRSD